MKWRTANRRRKRLRELWMLKVTVTTGTQRRTGRFLEMPAYMSFQPMTGQVFHVRYEARRRA